MSVCRTRRAPFAIRIIAALAALIAITIPAQRSLVSPAHADGVAMTFSPTTVVEDQREGGEPDIKTCGPGPVWSLGHCGLNNPYVSWPYGFSTTASFISRSEDK